MAEATDIQTGGPVLPSVSVAVVARLLDVTERRVQQLAKQGILTKNDHGKYDLLQSGRAYIRYLHLQNKEIELDPEKMSPKDRLDFYRGTREREKALEESRKLIHIAEVEQVIATAFSAIAQGIRSIPDHLERRTGCAPEIAEEVERLLDEEMTILADRLAVLSPVENA
jgi:phage terminase Nu1 subunit (DNA packaging protein)